MKYLITEVKIKNFIKNKLGVDLDNRIAMVTNKWELPMEFDRIITPQILNMYLNKFGPMYVIKTRKNMYLVQDRGEQGLFVVNQNGGEVDDYEVMKDLGIEIMGLKVKDLISYYDEE